MSVKAWRVAVSEFGKSTSLREDRVEAENWMNALKTARKGWGEPALIPAGASCTVAPDGTVTVLDAASRRSYQLTPMSKEETQASSAVENASPPKTARRKTVAYVATNLPTPGQLGPPPSPKIRSVPPPPAPPAAASQPVAPSKDAPVATAKPSARPSGPPPAPPEALAARPRSVPPPSPVLSEDVRPSVSPPTAAAPPAQVSSVPSVPPPPSSPLETEPSVPTNVELPDDLESEVELLLSRDEEPTADNPLIYRERAYYVGPDRAPEEAEQVLRRLLEKLENGLASRPAGKFINLAAFDHRWNERPSRPPLVALQWKDWRGEPEAVYPTNPPEASVQHTSQPPSVLAEELGTTMPFQPESQPVPAQVQLRMAYSPQATATAEGEMPRRARATSEQSLRLNQVFDALQDLFFLTTPQEGLAFAIRLLQDVVPSEAGNASLYELDTDRFRIVSTFGPASEQLVGREIAFSTPLYSEAARLEGTALLVEDLEDDARGRSEQDMYPEVSIQTLLMVALVHGGRILGMIQLVNRIHQGQFSRADANLAAYVAKQLSEFLYTTARYNRGRASLP